MPTEPELTAVVRPNGRTYRPRKPPRAFEIMNYDAWGEVPGWIYVIGTNDIATAYQLASGNWRGVDLGSAEQTWLRDTIRNGERCHEYDPVRGAPAVIFEWFD